VRVPKVLDVFGERAEEEDVALADLARDLDLLPLSFSESMRCLCYTRARL